MQCVLNDAPTCDLSYNPTTTAFTPLANEKVTGGEAELFNLAWARPHFRKIRCSYSKPLDVLRFEIRNLLVAWSGRLSLQHLAKLDGVVPFHSGGTPMLRDIAQPR
jgi:hypothetical protein